jgi:predicted ArsR family transcriptional regulator
MVKKGKLNKAEKFYIEGNSQKSAEDIAADLDRSVAVVKKHLATVPVTTPTEVQQEATNDDGESRMFQLMGRHKRQGKHVATVMTRAASELADETRTERTLNRKLQQAIHKPKSK